MNIATKKILEFISTRDFSCTYRDSTPPSLLLDGIVPAYKQIMRKFHFNTIFLYLFIYLRGLHFSILLLTYVFLGTAPGHGAIVYNAH